MMNISARSFSSNQALRTVLASIAIGAFITTIWSFYFVDSVIGDTVANNLLGYDAKGVPISGTLMGTLFAFVSGLAGTFTACNICAFSAIAPLANEKRSFGNGLYPLLWLAAGLIGITGIYGAIGALIGSQFPQLSTAVVGTGNFPVRLLQSSVVFSTIGLIFIVWGLIALEIVRNPFEELSCCYPWLKLALMGMLIGGFLIGRPFPLFRKMFEYAASTHDPIYGALCFILQGLGNIVVMIGLFLLLTYGTGGRFERWLTAKPGRIQTFTATALLIAGSFFITYWGLRVPALFGIGWWPTIPWR